jgi:radical SAM superfamily enzyme YgiQ (UPF0313 family)
MKILLTQANKPESRAPVFPLGPAYLAGSLSKAGHGVRSFNLPFYKDNKEELKKTIADFCPDVIGVSLRNLDNHRCAAPVSFLPEAMQVVQICRESSKAKIVVGGAGFSIAPAQLLDYLGVDLGIVGEGEIALCEVLRAMEEGKNPGNIPGVVMRYQGKIRITKPRRIEDLDDLERPDRGIFEPKRYLQQGAILNARTKRGCSFNCIYCTTPWLEGKRTRVTAPRKVVDELEILKKDYGASEFWLTDNIFNYPANHAESICTEIISRHLDVKWQCITNPCTLSKDLLRLMKLAGCSGFTLGIDSGSPDMLRNLGKNFTVEEVSRSCSYCRELEMDCHCPILLGGPGENRKTVEETVSLMERLRLRAVSISAGVRVYPNTKLAQIARDEGVLNAHSDLLSPTFYLSTEVKDWIFDYLRLVKERTGWRVDLPATSGADSSS